MAARVGIEPSGALKTRKLLIPHSDKNYRIATNAQVRYTAGTWTVRFEERETVLEILSDSAGL